jgi:hypothetical protein
MAKDGNCRSEALPVCSTLLNANPACTPERLSVDLSNEVVMLSTRCSNVSTFHGHELMMDDRDELNEDKESNGSSQGASKLFARVVSALAIMFFLTFFAIIIFTLAINKRVDAQSEFCNLCFFFNCLFCDQ